MLRALTVKPLVAPHPVGLTLRSAAKLHPGHASSAASHCWTAPRHHGFRLAALRLWRRRRRAPDVWCRKRAKILKYTPKHEPVPCEGECQMPEEKASNHGD